MLLREPLRYLWGRDRPTSMGKKKKKEAKEAKKQAKQASKSAGKDKAANDASFRVGRALASVISDGPLKEAFKKIDAVRALCTPHELELCCRCTQVARSSRPPQGQSTSAPPRKMVYLEYTDVCQSYKVPRGGNRRAGRAGLERGAGPRGSAHAREHGTTGALLRRRA